MYRTKHYSYGRNLTKAQKEMMRDWMKRNNLLPGQTGGWTTWKQNNPNIKESEVKKDE